MSAKPGLGRYIGRFFGICVEREAIRDLPDEDLAIVSLQSPKFARPPYLAIVRGRSNQRVVERTPAERSVLLLPTIFKHMRAPVGVEDGSRVPAEERDLVGCPALLIDRNNSECATAASFPIDRDVFGVGL